MLLAQKHESSSMERRFAGVGGLGGGCQACEEMQTKECARHWQCDSEVEAAEDKPWRNEELRSLEVELPHIECREPKERRGYKATTSVGCDGFHPKFR